MKRNKKAVKGNTRNRSTEERKKSDNDATDKEVVLHPSDSDQQFKQKKCIF